MADKLLAAARKAAAEAEEASRRLQEVKAGSALSELAAIAKRSKLESDKAKLTEAAKKDREEAQRLGRDADEAEKKRGTTTVPFPLSILAFPSACTTRKTLSGT